jgi:hypothetical protein
MQDAALKKQLIRWEVVSLLWIVLVGGFMHSVYKLSGYWQPIALIAPVNESIWEHMKMFFWPGLFITIVQYLLMRQRVANFWLAKLVLLTLTPVLAFTTFVIYTIIVESMGGLATEGPTAVLSMLCAIAAQVVCCRVIIAENYSFGSSPSIPIIYVLLILSFSSFTYFPPKLYLFEHHDNYKPNGQYGLDADREQSGRTRE